MVLQVVGWILWGFVLLWGLGTLVAAAPNPDGGVRYMLQVQGLTLLAACAATALLPISRFWLLAAIPLAFLLPMWIMMWRANRMQARVWAMWQESKATGIPFEELVQRDIQRTQGK